MRVRLRAPSPRDEEAFLAAARRSRALHRGLAHPPATSAAFRAFLERARDAQYECRLVVDPQSDAIVGVVNLNEIVRGSFQSAYLGYYAFAPFEGMGFMRAGVAAAITRAFRELRLHRLEANIQPQNHRSIRLVRRLGFRKEGLSPKYVKVGGRWRDHERWALLRDEWSARRSTS